MLFELSVDVFPAKSTLLSWLSALTEVEEDFDFGMVTWETVEEKE